MATNICGAKTRNGTPCKRPAGTGTNHLGTGKCKHHGGASTGPPKGTKNARKHGFYEKVVRDRLPEADREIFDNIEVETDLKMELRILRYKLYRLLGPVEREMLMNGPIKNDHGYTVGVGQVVGTLKVDDVTKAFAIEKIIDGIRKIVKDMGETDNETDSLMALVEAIRGSGKK